MINNSFKRKISAIVLSAMLSATSLTVALPGAKDALTSDNDTSVSDTADRDNDDHGNNDIT